MVLEMGWYMCVGGNCNPITDMCYFILGRCEIINGI
jgi:hypothetical protein